MQRQQRLATGVLTAVGLAVAIGTNVSSQTRLLFPAQPVAVEFRVLASDGSPVLDLTPSEVVLKLDGKARQIRALDVVRFSASTPSTPAPPYATNERPREQRDYLILLEDDAIAPGTEAPIRTVVDRLLKSVTPADRVGVTMIPSGRGNVALTTDRDMVRSSLADLVGLSTRGLTDSDARCRTLVTLEALQNLFLALRRGPSTTLLFFSAGLVLPESVAPLRLGQPTETCIVRTNHYSEFTRIAELAGVNFYAFHAVDDAASAQPALSTDLLAGLELLTGAANGDLIRLTADTAPNIDRMVRETGAFYRATFEPDASERDDKVHRLDVSVTRNGVAVRTQPTIPIDKADTRPASDRTLSVADLLKVGDVRRDLPLRAAAYPSRGDTKDTVKMVVVFEAGDSAEPLASAAIALYDGRSRLTSQVTLQKEELSRTPPFTALSVKPGPYRMRVAAADAKGRVGTLDMQVQARLIESPPVTMSAMILGTRSTGRFAPKLLFAGDPALITYFEVYNVPKAAELSAALELAETADGPALGVVPATVLPGNDATTWQVQAGIALGQVPPGDYVLRALVVVDEKLVGKVFRTLRKQ